MFQLFEHQQRRAFGDDEAVAVDIERARGFLRRVVAAGDGGHVIEARHGDGVQAGFGAAGDDGAHLAAADHFGRFADAVIAGGAGGRNGEVGAANAVGHRNLARRRIRQHHRNHQRADLLRPFFEERADAFDDGLDAADTGAANAADVVAIFGGNFQAAVFDCLFGRHQRELGDAVGAARFAAAEHEFGVEVLDLAAEAVFQMAGIKTLDIPNAGFAGGGVLPGFFYVVPRWANDAHAGHDDATSFHDGPPLSAPTEPKSLLMVARSVSGLEGSGVQGMSGRRAG